MKKLFTYLMLGMLLCGGSIIPINANENGITTGVIPETDEEYNSPERVEQRKQKMAQLAEFENSPQARISKYTISLPLRGQKNVYYCAPASGEMVIDYQLGSNNIYTQDVIASYMGTTTNGTSGNGAASGLRSITGLSFTYQSLSEVSLYSALKADINAYIGLLLPLQMSHLYSGASGYHMVAAKGYSSNSVIYLDPWKFDLSIYGEHEVSLSDMERAIRGFENKIVW